MPGVHPTCQDEILRPLTATQQAAVRHVDGPLMILAGPGSGKTRVVTHRIAYLLAEGIPARQILALTFTNKAADEMRLRLDRLAPRQAVWMGTFHRFCARLLRQYSALVGLSENFSIYDTKDSEKLLSEALEEAAVALSHVTPSQIAQEISWAKSQLITHDKYVARPGRSLGTIVQGAYPIYQRRLLGANAVDFDDLLLHVASMLRENPELRRTLDDRYRYILVDEYQDTNFAQYAIVRALSQDHPNLAVTGDPDQSIYGWRGADLNNILDFEQDFPKVAVVRLEQNYRSTRRILRVADQLISNNVRRKHKELFTENPEGKPVRLVVYPSSRDEADNIASQIAEEIYSGQRRPRDFAIFYRVNSLSRSFENALRSSAIPYQIIKGLEFYQRKEIKDVIAYLHLVNNPKNDVAFLRVINTPPRRIGKTTVVRLTQHARRYGLSLLEAARESGLIDGMNKRAAANVAAFVALHDRLSLLAHRPLEEMVGYVLSEAGYNEWLANSGSEDDIERLANVQELLSDAREFDEQHPGESQLEEFLEQVSLVSDTDDWETESDKVSLMTLHAAKGLEFPVVFLTAVEEGMLPHERSREDSGQLEEERRLLFVGITRAEEELQLSYAAYRFLRGSQRMSIPSSFLMELPRDEMEVHEPRSYRSTELDEFAFKEEGNFDEYDQRQGYEDASEEELEYVQDTTSVISDIASRVVTAADLLGESGRNTKKADPEQFEIGMLVYHPDHGLGKVLALSGSGTKRTATVQFFDSVRERRFILIHSQLQPVKSSN
ncbi:MAG: UvrD-helicase domain-containing protein [Planctomycetaceae bacterium]|nr:UvrD-helicase domain-containing protein [Planctomycetales bacterium]MCB9925248.1 UvrD-helicase domain-containing protein [Planctomycetaceae bacterium]